MSAPDSPTDALVEALTRHDEALVARGLAVWVGGEPTFTDRFSFEPEWNTAAEGEDKRQRAQRLTAALARRHPGAALLRTVGRQYPGEDLPRFSLGVYARRDGSAVWSGPPDPCLVTEARPFDDLRGLRAELARQLRQRGFCCLTVDAEGRLPTRLLVSKTPVDGLEALDASARDELQRASVHDQPTDPAGARDALAERGLWLFCLGEQPDAPIATPRIELPRLDSPRALVALLAALAEASTALSVPALVLAGHAPPVDESVAWTTVTPDPGVLEVNLAPCPSGALLLEQMHAVYADAQALGLFPERLFYNGDVTDSGGGGHLTLGGPTAAASPFFLYPRLLPRLVSYLVAHPALSYVFSEHAGSSSQAPRVDESVREGREELALALTALERGGAVSPEQIWRSLAPFLVDRFGNTHRAEINIEKLYNPYLPARGKLGLVELRALRMARSPARWAALAALFRALVGRLCRDEGVALVDWGVELHDRFALPFFLREDLRAVLDDLRQHRLGLDEQLEAELLQDDFRLIAELELPGARLELRRALEFWPLIGDLAAHDQVSRLRDASTSRVELCLRASPATSDLTDWQLLIDGHRVPLHAVHDGEPARLTGVRYRTFNPQQGLHPLIPAHGPLELVLSHPQHGATRVRYFDWRPDGAPYDGLPTDRQQAAARRRDRVLNEATAWIDAAAYPDAPAEALTPFGFDTRWLPTRR